MQKPDATNVKLLINYTLARLPEKLHGAVADAMKAGFDRLAIEKGLDPVFSRPPVNLLETLPEIDCEDLPDVVKDGGVTSSETPESGSEVAGFAEQRGGKAPDFDFRW